MAADLPTPACSPRWHEQEGDGCPWCCDACNYDKHICPACGDNLRHDRTDLRTGAGHYCLTRCANCQHIGHEHYDGACRECDAPCQYRAPETSPAAAGAAQRPEITDTQETAP